MTERRCSNCKYQKDTFNSSYSGKPMTTCKIFKGSNISYQKTNCEQWEHFEIKKKVAE